MKPKKHCIDFIFILLVGFLYSCQEVGSNVSDRKEAVEVSGKIERGSRFRLDTMMNGMNVKLILNRADVPVDTYTDFYLKVDDKESHTVSISTDVAQGMVTQNKEPYYYGIKGKPDVLDIKLMLFYKDKGERIKIGDILIPVEQKI